MVGYNKRGYSHIYFPMKAYIVGIHLKCLSELTALSPLLPMQIAESLVGTKSCPSGQGTCADLENGVKVTKI